MQDFGRAHRSAFYERPLPWRYIVDDEIGAVTILDAEDRRVASMNQVPPQGETDAQKIVDAVNSLSLVFLDNDDPVRTSPACAS